MNETLNTDYKPGDYGKKRMSAAQWADVHVKQWGQTSGIREGATERPEKGAFPCICISRQIGVGALEIADLLSENIACRVIDREILEYMAKEKKLSEKSVAYFDERYPGLMSELFSMLTSEKTFLKSDYARQLAKTVMALAGIESTVFVGRGTHLILPRTRVLAVRLIAGTEYRVDRVARLLNIRRSDAGTTLKAMDIEQADFFKTVYGKTGSDPLEYDLVINLEYLKDSSDAAEIMVCAFKQKFGSVD